MKIRTEESVPDRKFKESNFPELSSLKNGEVAVYPIEHATRVRNTCSWLKRHKGISLITRTDAEKQEVTVRLKKDE